MKGRDSILGLLIGINPVAWSAIFYALSFNLGIAFNSIGFILFLGTTAIYTIRDLYQGIKPRLSITVSYVLILLFAIILIREITIDLQNAFSISYYYLALILTPLGISVQKSRLTGFKNEVLTSFLIGCILSAVVNISYALYRGVLIQPEGINFWYFSYDFLSEPFGIQPIYLAFFYVFGIIILWHFKRYFKSRVVFILIILLLTFSILMLSARNALICLMVFFPLYLLLSGEFSRKYLLIGLVLVGICGTVALQNPVIRNRVFKVARSGNVYSGTSLRAQIWTSSLEISSRNPMWGIGEVATSEALMKKYRKHNLEVPLKYNYHTHNEYLQILVQYGVVGFLALSAVFLLPGIQFIRERNYLGFVCCGLIAVSALTESILHRQWGIFSLTFFISYFDIVWTKKEIN